MEVIGMDQRVGDVFLCDGETAISCVLSKMMIQEVESEVQEYQSLAKLVKSYLYLNPTQLRCSIVSAV